MNMNEQSFLTVPAFTGGKNSIRRFKNGSSISEIERSKQIQATLGVSVAAAYLRNRNYSIEACLWILLAKG